jgi:ABC-type dipeptide/oligopeptide/nickel transport system ATPase component
MAPGPPGKTLLSVKNLTRHGAFEDISFFVHRGEIVGLAGLVGAGRSEVARAIFGADKPDAGAITIGGKALRPGNIDAAIAAGIALVPEDRQHTGLVLPMAVSANLTMAVLSETTTAGLIQSRKERAIAPHPSLKPQSFMRQVVRASLPLGDGIVLDPFMGSGSTIAAAAWCGYRAIGLERSREYYDMAIGAIPQLVRLKANGTR